MESQLIEKKDPLLSPKKGKEDPLTRDDARFKSQTSRTPVIPSYRMKMYKLEVPTNELEISNDQTKSREQIEDPVN